MRSKLPIILPGVFVTGLVSLLLFLGHDKFAVLSPAGTIAHQQRNLLVMATLLMLLVVIPVFGLTIYIAWKYRASNSAATYRPDWDGNRKLETLWWGIPCAIILVLAVVAWNSSHSLDPTRQLVSGKHPLTIQVVALQWKWLFIYPRQQIASVNYLQIPVNTPINFEITADAPMNSFWIPRLGGQIYAMSGMMTQLHLMASQAGDYQGSSANISGAGFAAMHFVAAASSEQDFNSWVLQSKTSPDSLSLAAYTALARPGVLAAPEQYAAYEPDLFNKIMMKYMAPSGASDTAGQDMPGMASEDTSGTAGMPGMTSALLPPAPSAGMPGGRP